MLVAGSILAVLAVIATVAVVMLPSGPEQDAIVGATASSTSAYTTSTQPLGTTTTVTSIKPKRKSPATSLYGGAGLFEDAAFGISFHYPKSWVRYPLDDIVGSDDAPTVAVGVGDPEGTWYGGGPANYVIVFADALTEEGATKNPSTLLKEAVTHWGIGDDEASVETLEPIKATLVNGMQAAETTWQFDADGHTMVERFCLVLSGRSFCVFFMCTERKDREKNWPLFDATLQSLRLGVVSTWT
ncbi:MAG TPA: hypothetical protein VJP78_01320 [Thermoleophilia bacterium]|nr:hypothetical protein [Thermoleophilia bacterium]